MSIPGAANPLLLATAAAGGYTISRSLRFNSSDSAYLSRTPASAGNRQSWTWSGWVKRSNPDTGARQVLFSAYGASNDTGYFEFGFDNGANLGKFYWSQWTVDAQSTAVFRDFSAWYHIVVNYNGSNIVVYVNGTSVLTSAKTGDLAINGTFEHGIGRQPNSGRYFSGYLADIHFIDGQALTPSSFTEVSATTGQLIPKAYTGTFTGNSFWLKFADNSAATATTLGKDSSGLGNNWTPNNLSVTAGAGNDSLVDTPTSYGTDTGAGGEVRGNYCTLNPLAGKLTVTLSDGNLTRSGTVGNNRMGTIGMSSGKWYWEVLIQDVTAETFIGVTTYETEPDAYAENYVYNSGGGKYIGTTLSSYGASYGVNDIIGVAYDADNGTLTCYKNGVSQGQLVSGISKRAFPLSRTDGTGQHTFNFGQRPFAFPVSGFKALCDTNLPAPVVAKPSTVMDVALYTGNSTDNRAITGLGFSPDLVWFGPRSQSGQDKVLCDSVRGTQKALFSNQTYAEANPALYGSVGSFDASGFTIKKGTDATYGFHQVNLSGSTYAAWCWDAGSSTVTLNPGDPGSGSITTSVRASASSGFSVVSWSGVNGANGTIGHGLGVVAPQFVILKNRGTTDNWRVYHVSVGATGFLQLASTGATVTSDEFQNTSPTSSVFYLRGNTWNAASNNYIGYFFAPVAGYSSAFTYTGNQSEDGPMVYLGFRPRWIWIKSSTQVDNHYIYDTARATYNQTQQVLNPNGSNAEDTTSINFIKMDILSNGFKVRANQGSGINASGQTYVGFAFAENPFQYARAR